LLSGRSNLLLVQLEVLVPVPKPGRNLSQRDA
jgi:hypothetical protein